MDRDEASASASELRSRVQQLDAEAQRLRAEAGTLRAEAAGARPRGGPSASGRSSRGPPSDEDSDGGGPGAGPSSRPVARELEVLRGRLQTACGAVGLTRKALASCRAVVAADDRGRAGGGRGPPEAAPDDAGLDGALVSMKVGASSVGHVPCVHACMHACVHACMRACVHALERMLACCPTPTTGSGTLSAPFPPPSTQPVSALPPPYVLCPNPALPSLNRPLCPSSPPQDEALALFSELQRQAAAAPRFESHVAAAVRRVDELEALVGQLQQHNEQLMRMAGADVGLGLGEGLLQAQQQQQQPEAGGPMGPGSLPTYGARPTSPTGASSSYSHSSFRGGGHSSHPVHAGGGAGSMPRGGGGGMGLAGGQLGGSRSQLMLPGGGGMGGTGLAGPGSGRPPSPYDPYTDDYAGEGSLANAAVEQQLALAEEQLAELAASLARTEAQRGELASDLAAARRALAEAAARLAGEAGWEPGSLGLEAWLRRVLGEELAGKVRTRRGGWWGRGSRVAPRRTPERLGVRERGVWCAHHTHRGLTHARMHAHARSQLAPSTNHVQPWE
jgi:hypothetical protein